MKKSIWTLIMTGILSTILFSCASTKFVSRKKDISLIGNPSTGYTWTFVIEDESVIQVDEDITYLGKNGVLGAPSLFVYTIHSLKSGETTLKFEYKRIWENKLPKQIRVYNVFVKENGKIIIKEKKVEESDMNTFKSVTMEEGLKLMSEESDSVLLDVRTPEEFAEGHIPGAIQLTNETFTRQDAEKLISDKNRKIYCYCRSGRRSKQSCQKLIDFGYKNVVDIGGILSYTGEIEK